MGLLMDGERERYTVPSCRVFARLDDGLVHSVLGLSTWQRGGVTRCDKYYVFEQHWAARSMSPMEWLHVENTEAPMTCLECLRLRQ